ncbi:MAG: guanylate kinase [Elusimicrobia bacterium RIFCSPHIGHO2_02_FULL_57_9]|nr:MAG: guanylate kinase [Elusimicrobia bacterium RIFCSPHIGHO2_02_FULL_57_9]
MPKGVLIVISAPSGTGKSTICRRLLERREELRYSMSCTTRLPRPGEKTGRDYFFVTKEEFKRKISRSEFLEWAVVHDHYYGTPRHFIESTVKKGRNVLLAIDIQGASSIRRKLPEDSVLIFLAPPSLESLKQRLAGRRDCSQSVAKRLANSKEELVAAKDYDYLVVNDDLDKAVSQIEHIVTAEGLKVSRQDISALIPVGKLEEQRQ